MVLTEIRDLDLEIMSKMDDKTLLNYCKTNNYARELCSDENFWKKRVFLIFPNLNTKPNTTWKRYYIEIIYWIERLIDDYGFDPSNEMSIHPKVYYSEIQN